MLRQSTTTDPTNKTKLSFKQEVIPQLGGKGWTVKQSCQNGKRDKEVTREGKVPICEVMKVEILKAEKLKTSGCRWLGTARNGIRQSCTEPNRQQTKKRERESCR